MTTSLPALLELFDLTEVGPNHFVGRSPDTSMIRVFGGQVAGQALAAAARTVGEGRLPHSLHAYFLRPGIVGRPIEFRVDRLRAGRAFDTRRVSAIQDGRTIFEMSASFHVPEDGPQHQWPSPVAPPPHTLPTMEETIASDPEGWPEFYLEWGSVDIRHVQAAESDAAETVDETTGSRQVWFKTSAPLPDDPILHACLLACFTDLTLLSVVLMPHGVLPRHDGYQMASLDHCVWFHRTPRVDDWMLYDQVSPSAGKGRGLAQGRVFAADGALIATVVQEGLVRPLPADH
ncbi:acyl-CoA thioesterase [Nocardia barduliensis]|uniref:acyl-CoA thioesterase n=1 Tax=Nocardia barduliensis TaxID=2736643 RepID=UPI001572596E|nr:acyl-CoA thioesterase II [Nocardia barduliensis]